jgi:hypothetical protein
MHRARGSLSSSAATGPDAATRRSITAPSGCRTSRTRPHRSPPSSTPPSSATGPCHGLPLPPAQFPSLAKPLAALVYVTTLHVTHRLAWVIETYGSLIEGGAGPLPNAVGDLKSSQTVVDATTGRYLEATSF